MNRFKELRIKHGYPTQQDLAKVLFVNQTAVSQWERGVTTPSNTILVKLSELYGVSIDELLGHAIKENAPTLTKKDERDIARDLENFIADMDQGDLMFDGDPMTPEARESVIAAMKLGLEAAKMKNKERFTPKKYQRDATEG